MLPGPIDPTWIGDRGGQRLARGRKRCPGAFFGNSARQYAACHFETMPDSGEDRARPRGRMHLGGEDSVSKICQPVVCKGFRSGIDAVGSPDAKDCKKPRNVGFDQRQRACRALLARTRQSSDLFKPRQQCDVSVHEDIPQPCSKKESQRPHGVWKRMTNVAADAGFQKFLFPAGILKLQFPESNTGPHWSRHIYE